MPEARYPGRCQCGQRFPAGATVGGWTGNAGAKVATSCPACAGSAPRNGAPAAQPRAQRPYLRRERAPLPQPTAAEAHAALVALAARLDPYQRQVAAWRPGAGNLRAVAGAGSGKTTTTVALVGELVESGAVHPSDLVVTTFTRKAADELQERLARVLPPGALAQIRCGTFHALAGEIVGRAAPGRFPQGRNMDGKTRAEGVPAAALLWGDILGWAGPRGLPGTGEEGLGLTDPDARAYALAVDVVRSRPHADDAALDAAMQEAEQVEGLPHLARAWGAYKRVKAALGCYDFADILAALHAGLAANQIPDGARVVIVDEAQDNSTIQIEIARLLAANGRGEVIFVGDVRQSIYGWRGAAPAMFREADVTLGAATLELPVNYRSGSEIVALGNRIADGKPWTLGAATLPGRDVAGAVTVAAYGDVSEEGAAVAAEIAAGAAAGDSLDHTAILARTNAQAGVFEAALVAARIPCVVVGGVPFFTRRDVADFLAYARLTIEDSDDALARIVNRPRRMLGRAFADAVKAAPGATLAARVAAAAESARASGQRAAGRDLAALLDRLRAMPWADAAQEIARLLTPPAQRGGDADEDKGGVLQTCASLAGSFDAAPAFLAFAARCAGEVVQAGADDALPAGRVVISTIHKAKGREWGTVYVSATAGVFPHHRCLDSERRMQEEERLFYVAVTRAKDALRLTYAEVGMTATAGGPSPFLDYVAPATPPEGPGGGERAPAPEVAAAPVSAPPVLTEREVEGPVSAPQVASGATGPFDAHAWVAATALADAEGAAEAPAPGGRFVPVRRDAVERLLSPLGFGFVNQSGQVVAVRHVALARGTGIVKVYTTIPEGEEVSREAGEDSIKVAVVWTDEHKVVPLHKRLPYACRTRGWRATLLRKIAEVAPLLDGTPCRRCGAPTVERKRQDGTTFRGCVRWQECKNEAHPRVAL